MRKANIICNVCSLSVRWTTLHQARLTSGKNVETEKEDSRSRNELMPHITLSSRSNPSWHLKRQSLFSRRTGWMWAPSTSPMWRVEGEFILLYWLDWERDRPKDELSQTHTQTQTFFCSQCSGNNYMGIISINKQEKIIIIIFFSWLGHSNYIQGLESNLLDNRASKKKMLCWTLHL